MQHVFLMVKCCWKGNAIITLTTLLVNSCFIQVKSCTFKLLSWSIDGLTSNGPSIQAFLWKPNVCYEQTIILLWVFQGSKLYEITKFTPTFWWGSVLFIFLVFLFSCTQCCQCFWIVHFWLPLLLSLTFFKAYFLSCSQIYQVEYRWISDVFCM